MIKFRSLNISKSQYKIVLVALMLDIRYHENSIWKKLSRVTIVELLGWIKNERFGIVVHPSFPRRHLRPEVRLRSSVTRSCLRSLTPTPPSVEEVNMGLARVGTRAQVGESSIVCRECGRGYRTRVGIPVFNAFPSSLNQLDTTSIPLPLARSSRNDTLRGIKSSV